MKPSIACRFTTTRANAARESLPMGIAGGAIIPVLFAHLKQHYDFQAVFLGLMVPCYLYILYYGAAGHRVGQHIRD